MCMDPVTMGMIASAASTVMQGYAAMQQGKYEQGVAEYNARRSENEAQKEKNIGVEQENKLRQQAAELRSRQRAQLGAAMVDIGSGSALALQEDTEMMAEIDARTLRGNYQDSAQSMMDEAELQRAQGKAAAKAGRNAFMGSLLSGAGMTLSSGIADKWFKPSSAISPRVDTTTLRGLRNAGALR